MQTLFIDLRMSSNSQLEVAAAHGTNQAANIEAAQPAFNVESAVSSTKFERSRKPFMMIIFCMILIVTSFLSLSIGLKGTGNAIQDKASEAREEHDVLQGNIKKEQLLREKLDKITASKLGGRLFETHTECLVRGINYVNMQLLGQDYFDYPSVANDTVKWVKDECDILMFTPQVTKPLQQTGNLTGWALLNHRTAKVVDLLMVIVLEPVHHKVLNPMKPWIYRLGSRFERMWLRKLPVKEKEGQKEKSRDTITESASSTEHYDLPIYFRLVDFDNPPCKLIYVQPAKAMFSAESSRDELEVASRRVTSLEATLTCVWRAYHFADNLFCISLILQLLCSVVLFAIEYNRPVSSSSMPLSLRRSAWIAWWDQSKSFEKDLYVGLSGAVADFILLEGLGLCTHLPACIYTGLIIIGITNFIFFLVPHDLPLPTIRHLLSAVKELWVAMRTPDTLVLKVSPASAVQGSGMVAAAKEGYPKISPTTTLQEDIEEATKWMAEQKLAMPIAEGGIVNDVNGWRKSKPIFPTESDIEPQRHIKEDEMHDVDLDSDLEDLDWSVVEHN